MSRKIKIRTFSLPAEDLDATRLFNQENVTILISERHLCAKDGIILLFVQYEEDDDDFISEGGLF